MQMRLPPQPPSLPPVYLNLLQTRSPRQPQAVASSDPTSSSHAVERVVPSAGRPLPRGSLIDIKA
jgi:hypothetical protein